MKRVGAVITFEAGTTAEQIRKALEDAGLVWESATVQDYDDQYGGPVWYIP
jgi:hypothetical protein